MRTYVTSWRHSTTPRRQTDRRTDGRDLCATCDDRLAAPYAVSGQLSSNPLAQPPAPGQPARALLYKRRRVKCHICVLYCISMTGLSMHSHIARIRNRISCSMSNRRRHSQLKYIQRVSLRRVLWPVYECALEAVPSIGGYRKYEVFRLEQVFKRFRLEM